MGNLQGVLVPAYGRDYKSRAQLEVDWLTGKDFLLEPYGKPINLADLKAASGLEHGTIQVRYGKLRKVTVLSW